MTLDKRTKDRVTTLLTSSNGLIEKVIKLGIEDRQALGLLTEVLQINKQLLLEIRKEKISLEFVKQLLPIIITILKEILGGWLSRYQISPNWCLNMRHYVIYSPTYKNS